MGLPFYCEPTCTCQAGAFDELALDLAPVSRGHRRRSPLELILTCAAASLLACAEPGPPRLDTDSAGGEAELGARLSAAELVTTIGRPDGPAGAVLGSRLYVALDRTGLLVADQQFSRVSRYDLDGTFRGSAGRHGDGPEEFRAITGIALVGADSIVVTDGAGYLVYVSAGRAAPLLDRRERLGLSPRSLCAARSGLIIGGYLAGTGTTVHQLGRDHGIRRSVRPLTAGPAALRRLQSNTLLACKRDRDVVAVGQPGDTVIAVYALDDTDAVQVYALPGLEPIAVRMHESGVIEQYVRDGASGYDEIVSILSLSADAFLVQTVRYAVAGSDLRREHVRSFIIGDGAVRELAVEIPVILALSDSHYVTVDDDPYPVIAVYRY